MLCSGKTLGTARISFIPHPPLMLEKGISIFVYNHLSFPSINFLPKRTLLSAVFFCALLKERFAFFKKLYPVLTILNFLTKFV